MVFTLPAGAGRAGPGQPALCCTTCCSQAAAATLREVAANPKHLGAQVGVLPVLHTWGQNLHHHPHVHCVVTGGGLSCDAQGQVEAPPRWVACRPGFFLPVRVLSRVFRGKFLARAACGCSTAGKLTFPGRLAALAEPTAFAAWLAPLYGKDWVVYAKPPFGGPEQVLKYLARYTHRVAISNQPAAEAGGRPGDVPLQGLRRRPPAAKTMTLSAEEFLRRFVQHVLPKGFVKIRHYGLLGQRHRKERLAQCRNLLAAATMALLATIASAPDDTETSLIAPAASISCPRCGGTRLARSDLFLPPEPFALLRRMPPLAASPTGAADTS